MVKPLKLEVTHCISLFSFIILICRFISAKVFLLCTKNTHKLKNNYNNLSQTWVIMRMRYNKHIKFIPSIPMVSSIFHLPTLFPRPTIRIVKRQLFNYLFHLKQIHKLVRINTQLEQMHKSVRINTQIS